jgi:2-dehydropantoate 2-reductase
MRIGVVGAGGVGGLLSGLLARAGHDVVIVARGAALEAIHARGVRVESPLGKFDARVEAVASPAELDVDAVFLAVKTWQVPEVAAALASRPGYAVPLQNGVDAPDQCVEALGSERVLGGLCHMLSAITEPGAVKHVGAPPRFTLGAWTSPSNGRAEKLVATLRDAGADAETADDFAAALWEKFLLIASFGGVGALTRSPLGAWRAIPETRALLVSALQEVRAVASAKGIRCRDGVVEQTLAFIDRLPAEATSSLQRDVVAGRPSEIDSLSGAVARIGASVAVDVPVHRTIYASVLPLERGARAASA